MKPDVPSDAADTACDIAGALAPAAGAREIAKAASDGNDGALLLDTSTGDINVQVPSNTNATVRASAFRGGVISDFPLNVMSSRWGGSTTADGLIGSGGRTLRLCTFNGNVTLRQGPPSGQ